MEKYDLPSGAWVEVRGLKGKDQTAVQDVLTFIMDDKVQQEMGAGVMGRMHDRMLNRIITAWSLDEPIPSAPDGLPVEDALDIDDYLALIKATEPLMDKINFSQATQT